MAETSKTKSSTSEPSFITVFALYDGMTQLDFTGPHQVLSRLPGAETIIASRDGGAVDAEGLVLAGTRRLADIPRCDLICLPGGMHATTVALDAEFLSQIRRLAESARYITSVCTGSLILGAAGLLKGRRAACHWAWRELLPLFGAIPDPGRVVRDGNLITGGGVTAGIDFAFTALAEVAGEDVAKQVQLGLEYAPQPPFDAGRPETAPAEIRERFEARVARMAPSRLDEARQAAARL